MRQKRILSLSWRMARPPCIFQQARPLQLALSFPLWESAAPRRNSFNPQPLISHLTNSNGCGNLRCKVLLTVSPLRPSFSPQPLVYPHSPLLPSTHRSLPAFPRALFSYTYELPHPTDRFAGPLFSNTYELLFPQLFCFDNHLRCPLLFLGPPSSQLNVLTSAVSASLYPEPRGVRYHLPFCVEEHTP
jgi:hypothetical protein